MKTMSDVVITFDVSDFEKKEVTVATRVQERMLRELDDIAYTNDRTRGYVIRQLLTRGLAAYRADGELKVQREERSGPLPAGRIRVSKETPDTQDVKSKK